MVSYGEKIRMELLQVKESKMKIHTYTFLKGLVGQLQKKKSDIGFANLFMVPDRMKYIDYTDPYMIEYASFMLSTKSFQILLLAY